MNERIKELMIQSGMVSEVVGNPNGLWTTKMSVKTAEKFAEMIVRECVGLIVKENDGEEYGTTGSDWGDGYTAGLNTAKLAIEEHFEIKEN